MFEHRLASLLGRTVAETLDSLSVGELDRWRKYWNEEPWGAYRDNMHAGLIISELLKPHMKENSAPFPISAFMLEAREDVKERRVAEFVNKLDILSRRDRKKSK